MKNCPKCKLPISPVFYKDSEIICSLCGIVDASREYIQQAKKIDFKIRFLALVVFWIIFLPIGIYSRSDHSGLSLNNQSLIAFAILFFVASINFLAWLVVKNKFPEIKID
jgi:hypothetical protein